MLAELRGIYYIIEEFCMEHYVPILICSNVLALVLAIICLFRTSKKRRNRKTDDYLEELKLNLNIEKAEVKIGQVRSETGYTATEEPMETVEEEVLEEKKPTKEPEPIVIEKLIPMDSGKPASEQYFTSRSGKVYSKEDVLKQIKD